MKIKKQKKYSSGKKIKYKKKMKYKPNSKILILSICSFNKAAGGKQAYDESSSILSMLEPDAKKVLLDDRKKALDLLQTGEIKFQGSDSGKHSSNQNLIAGKDFGCNNGGAEYLQAIDRYEGRFFENGLKDKGKQKLLDSPHHILFITGLYGLVMPTEPIQLYGLPVEPGSEIINIWKENLTKILINYIKKHKIKRLFDFTAIEVYRKLIDLEKIKEKNIEVLYCFSSEAAGADALKYFGIFLREYLLEASEYELMSIKYEEEKEKIYFRSIPEEKFGCPGEAMPADWPELLNLDKIDSESRDALKTAEKKARDLYKEDYPEKDEGSLPFVQYGKGLEILLHNNISVKIRERVLEKFGKHGKRIENKYFNGLPFTLKNILKEKDEKQIAIGQWKGLREDIRQHLKNIRQDPSKDNKVVDFVDFVDQHLDKLISPPDFDLIKNVCSLFSKDRNLAAHNGIVKKDDMLEKHKEIVNGINKIIELIISMKPACMYHS